jgi:hypothetical protein
MPEIIGRFRLGSEFFVKRKLVNRCLKECATNCCDEGVFLTPYDAQQIVERCEEIQPYLRKPFDFGMWDLSHPAFITTPVLDEGAPSQQCWFFTGGRRCALHSFALDKNVPLRSVKPFFCVLFPLTLVDIDINVTEIMVDIKAYKTCLVEGEQESWLYEQFEPELRRIIGDEGYSELRRRFPD